MNQYGNFMPFGQQPNFQPSFQMPQQQGINGRVVNNVDEIFPNEVPTNGSVAFFPNSNGSEIYAKAWNPDGKITTIRYVPATEKEQSTPTVTLTDVMDSLQDIQDLIKEAKKPARRTTKKETNDE